MDAGTEGSSGWENLLPLVALGAGFVRPQIMPSLMNTAQVQQMMNQRRHQQEQERRALAKEQRAQEASAAMSRALGLSGLEGVDPSTLVALSNMLRKSEKIQETRGQKRREETELEALGSIEAALPTELPDVLAARVAQQPPVTAAAQEPFKRVTGDLAKRRALYAQIQAAGRPSTPPPTLGPPSVLRPATLDLPSLSPTFGLAPIESPDVPPLALPPENVQEAQRFAWEQGKLPTPQEAESQFQIPVQQWPGGEQVARERVKPPYPPHFERTKTGDVTGITVSPETGQLVSQGLGTIGEAKGSVPLTPDQTTRIGQLNAALYEGSLSPAAYQREMLSVVPDVPEARLIIGQALEERARQAAGMREDRTYARLLENAQFDQAARTLSAVGADVRAMQSLLDNPFAFQQLPPERKKTLPSEFVQSSERYARLLGAFMRSRAPEELKRVFALPPRPRSTGPPVPTDPSP